jgi:ABC-type multidrug transport system fused ATPase/permease subunit
MNLHRCITFYTDVTLLRLCRVQGAYVSTNRELKRLDALAFSPIFQSFGETLAGLATIRAFGKQQQFRDANLVGGTASSVLAVWWSPASLTRQLQSIGAPSAISIGRISISNPS